MSTKTTIYLDHNATTPMAPQVIEVMTQALRDGWGNPSSNHPWGRAAKAFIDTARQQVAELLHCEPDEVVFTGGGTEANNLAIHGITRAHPHQTHLIYSNVEHPAVQEPMADLVARGHRQTVIGVNATGQVSANEVLSAIRPATALISIMLANNETGALQPLADIANGAGDVWVHTDAAQAVGKVHVNVNKLGVDLLSVAGHKLYGPKGVGALFVRRGTPLDPVIRGASHEGGLRPGTENVAAIAGLGAACALAIQNVHARQQLGARTRRLLEGLRQKVPGLRLHGPETERLPNTLNVGFPNVSGSALLGSVPHLAAGTGSACHEGQTTGSVVLRAMGLSEAQSLEAVRLSLGHENTDAQIDTAICDLSAAWLALQLAA
ncbi:MAG: aminotransferase class V-fold PLP-dependent enzyme [Rhodobacterales bacterium]|nr:aminotransferase class V-fold PLP-dependent enzyme [Rhodobacterales bacterium]